MLKNVNTAFKAKAWLTFEAKVKVYHSLIVLVTTA